MLILNHKDLDKLELFEIKLSIITSNQNKNDNHQNLKIKKKAILTMIDNYELTLAVNATCICCEM